MRQENPITQISATTAAFLFILRNSLLFLFSDICIHDKGGGNPHAHVMLTVRPLNDDGSWGAKQRKAYILDKNGNKIYDRKKRTYKCQSVPTTDWNEVTKAEEWRSAWAEICNQALERNGQAERVDHRSYERQGIDQIPTVHLGTAAFQIFAPLLQARLRIGFFFCQRLQPSLVVRQRPLVLLQTSGGFLKDRLSGSKVLPPGHAGEKTALLFLESGQCGGFLLRLLPPNLRGLRRRPRRFRGGRLLLYSLRRRLFQIIFRQYAPQGSAA